MNKYIGWLVVVLFMVTPVVHANFIVIDSCWIVERNTSEDYYTIGFNLSWENCWRDSVNYDAGWVFMKYQKEASGDTWFHCTLDTLDINHQVWSSSSMTVDASFDNDNWGAGVMIYRADTSSGNVSCDSVHLRWYYNRGQTMTDADSCTDLRVFAIEMVYIPTVHFFVGDYDSGQQYCFYRYHKIDGAPYQITSEGAFDCDDTFEGHLWADDYLNSGTIPADYPKGYDAFYIMKYEISQIQYADFLNTLTPTQASNRFPDKFGDTRHYIKDIGGVYGVDGDDDNCLNGPGDGLWIACNWISSLDGTAYMDWAGLRPMTELELEKACRGPIYPVDDEFAWGTSSYTNGNLQYALSDSESVTPIDANRCATYPIRCGGFSGPSTTREEAGASYYGVMELSFNLSEYIILANYRTFTGEHGNGILTAAGAANVSNWPTTNTGWGIHGEYCCGFGFGNVNYARVANRYMKYNYTYFDDRNMEGGFRGCRSH